MEFFSSDVAAGTMIQQIFATQSALSRSEVFWFSFRYPKEIFFSPDLSCTVCAPMIRGILSSSFSDPFFCFFFLLIYFKWDPKGKKFFRSFGVQIWTDFYHPRSDGFLALQIRRFFAISDPTVFGHPRSDGFFTTQFPMDF